MEVCKSPDKIKMRRCNVSKGKKFVIFLIVMNICVSIYFIIEGTYSLVLITGSAALGFYFFSWSKFCN